MKKSFFKPITTEKNKDVGLVLVLAFLICFLRFEDRVFVLLSLGAAIVSIVLPGMLKPISIFWYLLAEILGTVMSRVILTLVFFLIITPMGLLKRLVSRDRMLMERWKKGEESVFTVRDKSFSGADLKNPF